MDRGAWWAIVPEVARIGHDLATKPCVNLDHLAVMVSVRFLPIKLFFYTSLYSLEASH